MRAAAPMTDAEDNCVGAGSGVHWMNGVGIFSKKTSGFVAVAATGA